MNTKLALNLGAILLVLGGLFSFWKHAEQSGFDRGFDQQQKRIDTLVATIGTKIDDIEGTSNKLAAEAKMRDEVLSSDVSIILAKTKGKTFTIVKNGECTPSPTFSDTINELNKRANQTMKGSQK